MYMTLTIKTTRREHDMSVTKLKLKTLKLVEILLIFTPCSPFALLPTPLQRLTGDVCSSVSPSPAKASITSLYGCL